MERKARGTKAESRRHPGTLGSAVTGPSGFRWSVALLVEEFPTSLDGHNYFPLITYFLRGCLLSITKI